MVLVLLVKILWMRLINARNMGYVPDGMSQEQMREMTTAFNLPK